MICKLLMFCLREQNCFIIAIGWWLGWLSWWLGCWSGLAAKLLVNNVGSRCIYIYFFFFCEPDQWRDLYGIEAGPGGQASTESTATAAKASP